MQSSQVNITLTSSMARPVTEIPHSQYQLYNFSIVKRHHDEGNLFTVQSVSPWRLWHWTCIRQAGKPGEKLSKVDRRCSWGWELRLSSCWWHLRMSFGLHVHPCTNAYIRWGQECRREGGGSGDLVTPWYTATIQFFLLPNIYWVTGTVRASEQQASA